MANPEQLEILKQGANAWNEWRSEHEDVRPDLRDANLNRADLSHANLSLANLSHVYLRDADLSLANLRDAVLRYADLRGAVFSHANLNRADLRHANLNRADFSHADFSHANLSGAVLRSANLIGAVLRSANLIGAIFSRADLSGANLNHADLSHVDLSRVDLSGAVLSGAHLTDAYLSNTLFVNNDLSEVKGLEAVRHLGPSEISISTIYNSHGKIPVVFLRGCGVPEPFIVQIPALVAALEPIQFYSCFISYSSKDHPFAERLHADLQSKGVRCWFAPEDLKIGDRFRDRIDESIRLHDKLLIILSENSVASPWVSDEVESAIEREHREKRTVLFPIKIDDAVMESQQAWAATIRRTRHIGDFTRWKEHDSYRKAFDRLLRDLKAEEKPA